MSSHSLVTLKQLLHLPFIEERGRERERGGHGEERERERDRDVSQEQLRNGSNEDIGLI